MQSKRKIIIEELNEVKGSVWVLLSFLRPGELKVFMYINDVMQCNTHCSTTIPAMAIAVGLQQKEVEYALVGLESIGMITEEVFPEIINRKLHFNNMTSLHKLLLTHPVGYGHALRCVIGKQGKMVNEITTGDLTKADELFKKWTAE